MTSVWPQNCNSQTTSSTKIHWDEYSTSTKPQIQQSLKLTVQNINHAQNQNSSNYLGWLTKIHQAQNLNSKQPFGLMVRTFTWHKTTTPTTTKIDREEHLPDTVQQLQQPLRFTVLKNIHLAQNHYSNNLQDSL